MKQPPFEVADIIRQHGKSFIEKNRSWLTWLHLRVLFAIEHCRTAALGGHLDRCCHCGHEATSFNSCRSRHCPKCQTNARNKWLAERGKELLPVKYVHVVFTIPHQLSWLALQNKKIVYDLLFRASAATLLEMAADPKHLGAEIGFLSVLPTWGQNLQHHPHIHCVIPAGGLSADHTQWVHPHYPFFLPVKMLSRVFRGKFIAGLQRAFCQHTLVFPGSLKALTEARAFHAFLRPLFRQDWVVYSKRPFGGPQHVLQYLARYTHRVAISNHRIVDVADGRVTFRWKDYAHKGKQKLMTLNSSAGGLPGEAACVIPRSLHSPTEPRLAPARTLAVCPDTANSQKTEPNCALSSPSGDSIVTEKPKTIHFSRLTRTRGNHLCDVRDD